MAAEGCFNGLSTSLGVYPIVVTISNGGPAVDGNIAVDANSYNGSHRYMYPISLPSGSTKQVITYPDLSQGADQIKVSFDGAHSSSFPAVTVPLQYGDSSNTRSIGLIGDKIGGMAAMREINADAGYNPSSPRFSDSYASPENAPDRASGYESLTAVVVSDGAERMSPGQWRALRQWVIGGGSVILLGGADASFLKMPDADPIVPLTNIHATVFEQFPIAIAGGGSQSIGPVAAQTGDPKPGVTVVSTIGAQLTVATERLGAGVVIYSAVNPLDKPIHSSPGITGAWKQLAGLT